MATEIERRWLVGGLPDGLKERSGRRIRQGYVVIAADGSEVRLRRRGKKRLLTVKSGEGLVREEHEVELTDDQFGALWPATAGRRLEKRRYRMRWERRVLELDVYAGPLQGLIIAEVEFPSAEESRAFEPPPWCGREITGDAAFRNQCLATRGLPDKGEANTRTKS